jgi:hypothetical protein
MIRMQFKGFKKYREQLIYLQKNFPVELEQFLLDVTKAVDRATTKRTPVEHGELKNGWKISKVEHEGDKLFVTYYNDATTTYEGRKVPLAPFVEFGHKVVDNLNGTGKVVGKAQGYFMLTTSIKAVNKQIPRRLRKMFDELVARS